MAKKLTRLKSSFKDSLCFKRERLIFAQVTNSELFLSAMLGFEQFICMICRCMKSKQIKHKEHGHNLSCTWLV